MLHTETTIKNRAARAAYMREYNAKNRDVVNAQDRARLVATKNDPEKYAVFREAGNIANRKYAEANRDKLRQKSLARNRAIYTPERGKELREKYSMGYATQISMKSARKRAAEKGLPFDLTPEWYDAEFEKGCAVTGLPLLKNGSKSPWTAHVDKIIPANGYVQSNCRLVCACFNLSKKNWTDADVLRMAQALVLRNADA